MKDSPSEVSEDKKEIKSENQSLLGAVEPLDWLFTADSEPEPLSSPKLVNVSGLLVILSYLHFLINPIFRLQGKMKVKVLFPKDLAKKTQKKPKSKVTLPLLLPKKIWSLSKSNGDEKLYVEDHPLHLLHPVTLTALLLVIFVRGSWKFYPRQVMKNVIDNYPS